jgi:hypothetical protein
VASGQIVVLDEGHELSFSFEDMLKYHGRSAPAGVAHAFKVLERALPALDRGDGVERRGIIIETAFGGPGARDALELVTRAVTEERFVVDPTLARAELGRARERFVFRLRYLERSVTVVVRDGVVSDEFVDLARRRDRSPEEERRLTAMKGEMAGRVMSAAVVDVYDIAAEDPA